MEKTKILVILKEEEPIKIKVEGNDRERVKKYKYLGTIINNQ